MSLDHNASLRDADPAVARLIDRELRRQQHGLELIASENFASRAVIDAMGTPLTNKYAEGYPGRRYYGGCEVDRRGRAARHRPAQAALRRRARQRAAALRARRPTSPRSWRVHQAGRDDHGHVAAARRAPVARRGGQPQRRGLAGGALRRRSGHRADRLRRRAGAGQARSGPSSSSPAAARTPGSSTSPRSARSRTRSARSSWWTWRTSPGWWPAGVHPSPVPHAPIVTSTTHKTLRGPRAGLILSTAEHAKAIDKSVFPGTQGGPLEHVIAAKAVAFGEALTADFKRLRPAGGGQRARRWPTALIERGFAIVSGGTDTHLMLVDLRPKNLTGKAAEKALDQAGITVNKNTIPDDPQSPFVTSGIRLGTPALTTRGMGTARDGARRRADRPGAHPPGRGHPRPGQGGGRAS